MVTPDTTKKPENVVAVVPGIPPIDLASLAAMPPTEKLMLHKSLAASPTILAVMDTPIFPLAGTVKVTAGAVME